MAERKIAGKIYKVEPMLARDSLRLMGRLVKVGGAAWDRFKVNLENIKGKDEVAGLAVQALVDIVRNNDLEEVIGLIEDILAVAMVQRPSGAYEPVDLDGDFSGHLPDAYQVAAFVLQEQFSDFFSDRGLNGGRTKKAAA